MEAEKLENAPVDFGVLSRVEKAVYRHISAYRDLPKWHITHRDGFPLLLVPPATSSIKA
jgi:hypothetical protein